MHDATQTPRSDVTQHSVRVAGLLFLLYSITAILHYSLIETRLFTANGLDAVAVFVQSEELFFRIGAVLDLAVFLLELGLAVALHALLRAVSEPAARFALACLVLVAALTIGAEISSPLALRILGDTGSLGGFDHSQRLALLGLVLDARAASYTVVLPLFSLGMVVNAFLLLGTRYVPSALAAIGVVANAVVGLAGAAALCTPSQSTATSGVQAIVAISSIGALLYQLTVGGWLMIRGARPE